MSKTTKTTPMWVRMNRRPATLSVADHDHRNGVCDLDTPLNYHRQHHYVSGSCVPRPSTLALKGPNSGCGCPMCTNRDARRVSRRQVRREGRLTSKRIQRGLRAGIEATDLA